jgi:hypothetical protein
MGQSRYRLEADGEAACEAAFKAAFEAIAETEVATEGNGLGTEYYDNCYWLPTDANFTKDFCKIP